MELRSAAGRRQVLARAARLGLLDGNHVGWDLAYVLAESPLLPARLLRAVRRVAKSNGHRGDVDRVVAGLCGAGWLAPVDPPARRPVGRPSVLLHPTEDGRNIYVAAAYTIQPERSRRRAACRYGMGAVLCEVGDGGISRAELVTQVIARVAWLRAVPPHVVYAQIAQDIRWGWLRVEVPSAPAVPSAWVLTDDGWRALRFLGRYANPPRDRVPRRLRVQDRVHDETAALVAASLLPLAGDVRRLTLGRRRGLNLDEVPDALAGDMGPGGYCVPDVACLLTTTDQRGRRRVLALFVEVERYGSLAGLRRHIGAYAALAADHADAEWMRDPLGQSVAVVFVTRRPARRADLVTGVEDDLPDRLREFAWAMRVGGMRLPAQFARDWLADPDAVHCRPPGPEPGEKWAELNSGLRYLVSSP